MTDPITAIATSAVTTAATTAATKGTTKLIELLFSKQVLNHKRLETLSDAQNNKDAELIQQGLMEFRDGKFTLVVEQIGNPISPLGLILAHNHQNQSENLGKCLNKAYEHLAETNDEQISDEKISETFFNKWTNYGKEVSEDELQDLWGSILAKEVTEPNSLNYLVLNTLSLMSKEHLEAFNSLLTNIVGYRLYCNPSQKAIDDYNYIEPRLLDELIDLNIIRGLAHSDIHFQKELDKVSNGDQVYPCLPLNNEYFIVFKLHNDIPESPLPYYNLTTVGMKLFDIGLSNTDIEIYFINLIQNLKKLPNFEAFEYAELIYSKNNIQTSIREIKI